MTIFLILINTNLLIHLPNAKLKEKGQKSWSFFVVLAFKVFGSRNLKYDLPHSGKMQGFSGQRLVL